MKKILILLALLTLIIGCGEINDSSVNSVAKCKEPDICKNTDAITCFYHWLNSSDCYTEKYIKEQIINPQITEQSPLTITYTFDFYDLFSGEKYCNENNCLITVTIRENVSSIKNIYMSDPDLFYSVYVENGASVECRNDLYDCSERWLDMNTEFHQQGVCFKPGGCISEEDKSAYLALNASALMKGLKNIRELKRKNSETRVEFTVESNGYKICESNSKDLNECVVIMQRTDEGNKVVYAHGVLRAYNINISKSDAKKIFEASEDCKKHRAINLWVSDFYRGNKLYEYDKNGLHWATLSGDRCGRTCYVNAETGQLNKGEYACE